MSHQAARAAPAADEILDGMAEDLPFPDASFDMVIASLVLCTCPDQLPLSVKAR
jgi:ubiquinone/menaquinone biosynthesis C-methylase UbiE